MSILKKNTWVIIVFVSVCVLALSLVAQEETDEILVHYKSRASEVFNGRNPLLSGLKFSFEATTYYKLFDEEKNTFIIDSIIADYYYSFEKIDSINVIASSKDDPDTLDLKYPNIFIGDYLYNFYPNDTGGKDLSIGFDSKDVNPNIPIGLAIVDRDYYFLKRLYMYYMNEQKVERASKSFRFVEIDGFIFSDSVWELKSKSGIFTTEYFRVETGIRNIKIQR